MLFTFEWAAIGVMIILNGIFSGYEMALASISHSRLLVLTQQKKHGAAAALHMKERMEASFAALQLGITLFSALAAAIGGVFANEHLSPLLAHRWGLSIFTSQLLAMLLFVFPLSLVTILFAELIPKLFALQNREWVCLWLSPAMRRLADVVAPIVRALEWIVKHLLGIAQKYFHALNTPAESASMHELRAAVALARTARVIGAREEKIVLSAAQLASRPIHQLVLPAADISMIPMSATLTEALLQAHLDLHTRFPVCTIPEDPQSIAGYITFKDLVVALKMKPSMPTVEGIIRPIKKIAENLPIAQVLEQIMREKIHIALVMDKENQVMGMITLEDIVEELLGDIEDEFDHIPTHFHPAGQGWIMGGGVSMVTVYQCLGRSLDNASPEIRTMRLAEWCTHILGRAVVRGDSVRAEGVDLTVRKLRRHKVSEAFISVLPAA
jgi:putative hemolysin